MSENMEASERGDVGESFERQDTEGQRLQDATTEPEAHVEQTRTWQEAEQVESVLTEMVDTAIPADVQGERRGEAHREADAGGSQRESASSDSGGQGEGVLILGEAPLDSEAVGSTMEDIAGSEPVPLGDRAESSEEMVLEPEHGIGEGPSRHEGEVTPIPPHDAATPITIPGLIEQDVEEAGDPEAGDPFADPAVDAERDDALEYDSIQATPITLPADPPEPTPPSDDLADEADSGDSSGEGGTYSPGLTHPGQSLEEDDVLFIIDRPGVEPGAAAGEVEVPGDLSQTQAAALEGEREPSRVRGAMEEDPHLLDVNLPQQLDEGMIEEDGASADIQDLIPEAGEILGEDDKPFSEDDDYLGDGFGSSKQGIESDTDRPENVPGTGSPFIPGKGPGAGAETRGGGYTYSDADEAVMRVIATGDEAKIAAFERKMQERALDMAEVSGQIAPSADQNDDPEEPPGKKGGSQSSPVFEGESATTFRREILSSPPAVEDIPTGDEISLTTPDDSGVEGTDGRLSEVGQKKMEQVKETMRKFVAPTMRPGAEVVTDPPEHAPGEDVGPGAGRDAGPQKE